MMNTVILSIFTISLILSIVATLVLDTLYFKKYNRFWRSVATFLPMSIPLVLIFGLTAIFYESVTWHSTLVFMLILSIVGIIVVIANYYTMVFADWRLRKLRKKYVDLPDGPQKESLLRVLDRIESRVSKEQYKIDEDNS